MLLKPKLIVTLGGHSTSHILQQMGFEAEGITRIHGKVYDGELFGLKVRVVPSYHPAAALYNPQYKEALEKDFQAVKCHLKLSD